MWLVGLFRPIAMAVNIILHLREGKSTLLQWVYKTRALVERVNLFLHELRVRVNRLLQSIDHNIRRLQKWNLELTGNQCLRN